MSHGGDIRGKTADISMVILAAGLSRRMGVFKPLLPVGDLPAILRCVRTAEEAGVRAAVVVTGHKNEELESVVRAGAKSAQLVHNSMYRDEMFSSVRVGVSALPSDTDGFFLLPADCCAFAHGTMISLIRRFADDGGKSVVRPINHGRRGHPPLIPARFIDPLLSFSGQNGLKGFLSPLPTVEVETNDAGTLLDMDTPDDYAALLEHLGLPCYPNRAQCAELMEKYHVPPNIVKHGEQVASVAIDFAHQMQARGALLDIALLESACLLHDIRKGAREDRGHAREGMDVLLREGYPKAAMLVGNHMDLPGGVPQDIGETELLYLADKLCRHGQIVALEDTMREMSSKFPPGSEAHARAVTRISNAQEIRRRIRVVE